MEIKLTFDELDQRLLRELIDAALKHGGHSVLGAAWMLNRKMNEAELFLAGSQWAAPAHHTDCRVSRVAGVPVTQCDCGALEAKAVSETPKTQTNYPGGFETGFGAPYGSLTHGKHTLSGIDQ